MTMSTATTPRVLVITGGLLTEKDTSLRQVFHKQRLQTRYASGDWLETKIKLLAAEPLITERLEQRLHRGRARLAPDLRQRMFNGADTVTTPDLTEVVLITALAHAGLDCLTLTVADLFADPVRSARRLRECDCVFLSTTFLRDQSELMPILDRLQPAGKHLVLGGPLVSQIQAHWPGHAAVAVLAVGYGEYLVPRLADWIHSGFRQLDAPPRGRIERRAATTIVFSGTPEGRSLDGLPRPEWERVQPRGSLHHVYYESVRGCPYRCGFCNYPYLFDDTRFRYRSAEKMADDWEYFVRNLGVTSITCLDSLFTIPRRRLQRFCRLLIDRNIRVRWLCYARADDLCDEDTLALMKAAGLYQVQIGIESGHQQQLDNMNKQCSIEANALALHNCRRHGVTSIVSLIVGYPGETAASLEATYRFLRDAPPDFYYLAAFSTRAEGVPILSAESRHRFALEVSGDTHTTAPYWRHGSMDCREAANNIRQLNHRLMAERISLNAVLFYRGLGNYRAGDRSALLDYQQRVATRHTLTRGIFSLLHRVVDRRLASDMHNRLLCHHA